MSDTRFSALLLAPAIALGLIAVPAFGQDLDGENPSISTQVASVTFGPYVRAEAGVFVPSLDEAYWLSPGAADPQVNFDLDGDNGGFGSIAVGYDWQNGFRADVAFLRTADMDFSGPCSSASDGTPCSIHANISAGSITTTALMANLFYSPYEQQGSNSVFQPFIVGGLGVARNEVNSWTRTNPAAANPVRVFNGNTESDFAWSLGVGAAWQVTRAGRHPIILEAAWRYYDFGTAVGGSVADVGVGTPRQPLTFDNRNHVFSIGVRIPLQRL